MSEIQNRLEEVHARFTQIDWHDSVLLNLHLLKDLTSFNYDLCLEIELNVGFLEGVYKQAKINVIFKECRIVYTDLDLLGVLLCGGAISDGICYKDSVQLEKEVRDKVRHFDLPEIKKPLDECLGFFIEMINPGGDIVIFAKDFELQSEERS